MRKKYDATLRELYELEPANWMEFLGIPFPDPDLVQVVDSNVSTVSAEADKVVRIGGPNPKIVHTEFLSSRNPAQAEQALWYNVLLSHKHRVPVRSVIVLLRPEADGPELTGSLERFFPGRGPNLRFWFDVVRVWLEPPEKLLTAGLAVLPLAPVAQLAPDRLAEVVMRVARRLKNEAEPELRKTLWVTTELLMGLRYSREEAKAIFEGVATMVLGIRGIEESWVYQDIFAKGRAEGAAEEARNTLLRQGLKKLGQPDEPTRAQIAAINDLERLELLLDRILDASNWNELLADGDPGK
jgi:hypothetical protein